MANEAGKKSKRAARRRPAGLGSVFKNGHRWWISYDDERGKRVRIPGGLNGKGAVTKTEAEEVLKGILAARHNGVSVSATAQRRTVGEYLDDYVADLQTRGAKGIAQVKSHLIPVRESFGELRPQDLTLDALGDYRERMTVQGFKPATINRGLQCLRAALRLAWKSGVLARPPYIPMSPERNQRTGFFEASEHEAIKAKLPAGAHADACEFGFLTGWRLGEILGLPWTAVDEHAVKLADSKNGEPRTFPLSMVALKAVIARREAARTYLDNDGEAVQSEYVFHVAGCRLWNFDHTWRAARKAAGLPHRLFHDYRRTAVRDLVRAGVPRDTAMAWTGHKTDAVFRRYNIVVTEDLERAAELLTEYREARAKAAAAAPVPTTQAQATVH
jgi:integrase